jgi:hypothetical protein
MKEALEMESLRLRYLIWTKEMLIASNMYWIEVEKACQL